MILVGSQASRAPDELEPLRRLLNTWEIPAKTRMPTDHLPDLAGDPQRWLRELPGLPVPASNELAELTELRDDLRHALDSDGHGRGLLDTWLQRRPPRPRVLSTPQQLSIRHSPFDTTAIAATIAIAADAIAQGTWPRLKACPDCRWVFYDNTRNGSRRWCGMSAPGEEERSCGSIAKVRAYRHRKRQQTAQHD